MIPFGKKRTAGNTRKQLIKHKQQLEKEHKKFPFKRVLSRAVIHRIIKEFEWEEHYLESIYDEATTINNYVNEYNIEQIKRKTKRMHNLNNVLDALQNIITKLSIILYTKMNKDDPEFDDRLNSIKEVLTQIGYLYRTLETLHENGSLNINTLREEVNNWAEVKERLQAHHNIYTSDEDFLEAQFKAIDYYFDNYDN